MLRLIEILVERLLPPPIHRAALKIAHKVRHRWRLIAKPELSGVTLLLRNADGHLLLVRHNYGPDVWSLPGGGMDKGEDPEEAIRREMREELSIELRALAFLGTVDETLSGTRHTAQVFTATTSDGIEPDGREIAHARFFPLNALPHDIGDIAHRRIDRFDLD
ncbi:MAG: NUDIX domain-containing protein [Pontixanthobacter sp.]